MVVLVVTKNLVYSDEMTEQKYPIVKETHWMHTYQLITYKQNGNWGMIVERYSEYDLFPKSLKIGLLVIHKSTH